jgi:YegS/Rv2252/BmrU family lipid kinase
MLKSNDSTRILFMKTSEKRKVLFVINPVSGSNDKSKLRQQIDFYCEKYHMQPSFTETTGHNDHETLITHVEEQNPDVVVAVGGDGTVNLVASVVVEKRNIKLGIIPAGSANGMAFELNIPANIERAMSVIARNVSKRIDLLKINGKHLTVHLSDLGMNARIIKRFDQEKIRGLYGYARQFFKELKAPPYFRCTVHCRRKKPQKYKAVMVVILNTHFFGTGAVINPTGELDDGIFEIVIIKPYPWYYLFRMIFAFFTGNIHRLRHVRILSCKQAKISLQPAQDLQIDGEPFGEVKHIYAEIVPSAIEIIFNDQEEHLLFNPSKKH